jgi:hypothetical protein
MQPHSDALGPTAPAHPPVQPQAAPSKMKLVWASIAAAAALLGILIGIVIGRGTKDAPKPPSVVKPELLAQLLVTSKPVDANVTVDGRFVGVSPVERIDLDAGKHSVVIDAFGYQPYAGTVEVEPKAKASLKVVLAPIGDAKETTKGDFEGAKTASNKAIPPTALAPISLTGTGTSKDAPATKKSGGGGGGGGSYRPPPPRRDCYNERDRCKSTCGSAETSCSMSCFGCSSCTSDLTSDQCKQRCESCRSNCKSNVTFCERQCEGQYDTCSSSQ